MKGLKLLRRYSLALGILIITAICANGQVNLTNLPPNEMNHRFYRDVFHMKRPGLSINGFDNGGDNSHGYGLKQIIEKLYNSDPVEQKTFQDIVNSARDQVINPNYGSSEYSIRQVESNSQILENLALVALVQYILYKNSVTTTIPGISNLPTSYETAIDNLHDNLLKPITWYVVYGNGDNTSDDPVKWTRSVDNYARAIDLYLALENAFGYYGENDYTETGTSRLLSNSQKYDLLNKFYEKVKDMHYYEYKLQTWEGIKLPGGTRNYEVEAGNRPLNIFVSMGYGALTLQACDYYTGFQSNVPDDSLKKNSLVYVDAVTGNDTSNVTTSSYLNEALRSAGLPTTGSNIDNSIRYWNYQTDNGEHFWAEGPYYFEYTLMNVIPFWYATRANNLLNYQNMNISDPFTHQWFLGPFDWLASLVTPDYRVPPLDDGNKQFIRYSYLLNWQSVFGSASTGQKYEWIYKGGHNENSAELVALGMPRVSGEGTAPPENVGDHYTYSGQSLPSQQVLLRKTINNQTHYLLLNGEQGDAITRGEGHEQPDQLKLLYYVDGKSYLMDSGYDAPSAKHNSTWNGYNNHNVMGL